jgi:hypothetical protein
VLFDMFRRINVILNVRFSVALQCCCGLGFLLLTLPNKRVSVESGLLGCYVV